MKCQSAKLIKYCNFYIRPTQKRVISGSAPRVICCCWWRAYFQGGGGILTREQRSVFVRLTAGGLQIFNPNLPTDNLETRFRGVYAPSPFSGTGFSMVPSAKKIRPLLPPEIQDGGRKTEAATAFERLEITM